ncbi:hypothetical protein ACX3YC_14600 [Pseudomonas mohnii]
MAKITIKELESLTANARNHARALIDEQINPNEHKKNAKAQAYATTHVEAEQVKTTMLRKTEGCY